MTLKNCGAEVLMLYGYYVQEQNGKSYVILEIMCGKGGIRTPDIFSYVHAFQACALDRSATFPYLFIILKIMLLNNWYIWFATEIHSIVKLVFAR